MALLLWVWFGCTVFVLGCAYRAYRYASAPPHLRWDLYPVAHEPNDHGGSYLEEKDWWTKPRESSLLGEAVVMGEEILFLAGVWKHNRRLWWGSFPFHWGFSAGSPGSSWRWGPRSSSPSAAETRSSSPTRRQWTSSTWPSWGCWES